MNLPEKGEHTHSIQNRHDIAIGSVSTLHALEQVNNSLDPIPRLKRTPTEAEQSSKHRTDSCSMLQVAANEPLESRSMAAWSIRFLIVRSHLGISGLSQNSSSLYMYIYRFIGHFSRTP